MRGRSGAAAGSPVSVGGLLREYVLGSRLLLLLCSLVLTSLLTFARPLIIKGITDEGMLQADMRMVLLCAMLLLLSAVCDQAVNIVQSRQFVDIQNSMLLALYRAAFDKLLRVKQDYFTHHNSAEIMNRLSMDIRSVSMIADRSILFVASYLLSFVGGLVGLFVLNPRMAVIVIVVIPLKALATVSMAKQNERITTQHIGLLRAFSSWFGDLISGVKVVKLWDLQQDVRHKLSDKQSEILQMNKKSALYSCYNQTLTRLLDSLVQCALYIYGGFLFMQGELSLGGVMAFISYSGYVLGPITAIMSIRYMFSSIRPSLKRLNAFFGLAEDVRPKLAPPEPKGCAVSSFALRGVQFSHTQDALLENINFTASPGEKIAIIGPNGSGKSTLIDLILRFARPQRGEILVNGRDAAALSDEQYWSLFAVVDQEPYFFQDTIRHNLDPAGRHTDAQIVQALTRCGAADFFQERFHGDLNHVIQFDAGDLSGGERKKLAIARAILKDAPIVILDEAAADYDFQAELHLSRMVSTGFPDQILIYITHNYAYLDIFDRVYQLTQGRLRELTQPEILDFKTKAFYAHAATGA